MYDALILGGGPAGLSAAVYLARFTRNVLVLDSGAGRSSFAQVNENYLGFPGGVTTQELRRLGRQQAEDFGAHFKECCVARVEHRQTDAKHGDHFIAYTDAGEFTGKTLLFATGVKDVWPNITGIERHIGRQVFWCITCDGWRAKDRKIVCVGSSDEAATTTLQFLLFTKDITMIVDPHKERISDEKLEQLASHNISIVRGKPTNFDYADAPDNDGCGDHIEAVCLDSGARLPCDMLFALLGVRPNTQLAHEAGVHLDEGGYIIMDDEGYTNIPGIFAAGDLTRMYTQQVASAVHAGAEAAQTMNYYLYAPFQRNVGDEKTDDLHLDCPDNRTPLMEAAGG